MPNKVVLFAAIAAGTSTALRFVPAPNHGVKLKGSQGVKVRDFKCSLGLYRHDR
ncbi:hypothetical protein SAMN05421647_107253 [Marinobacterium stanieri]|uniref:Uncharacterized protein n=1 Tax=Marinobacterium stanieri TaxID=49186 RepID=A0A1N6UVT1_9GAMM|nr:hypothetical protein SAMN05421647_107253 [Marinobacterium stanieri]